MDSSIYHSYVDCFTVQGGRAECGACEELHTNAKIIPQVSASAGGLSPSCCPCIFTHLSVAPEA